MSDHRAGNRREGKAALISGAAREMSAGHARAVVAHTPSVVSGGIPAHEGAKVAAGLGNTAAYVGQGHLSGTASGTLEGNRPWNT